MGGEIYTLKQENQVSDDLEVLEHEIYCVICRLYV